MTPDETPKNDETEADTAQADTGDAPETGSQDDGATDLSEAGAKPDDEAAAEPEQDDTDQAEADPTEEEDTQDTVAEDDTDSTEAGPVPLDDAQTEIDADDTPPADDQADDQVDLEAALATSPLISDGTPDPVEEPQTPDTEDQHEEDDDEDEHGRSLASRVLTGLVLLLAGGGLALWAAPKVAPGLPSGLGPVKSWLLPGEQVSLTRISALEAELQSRIEALELGMPAEDVAAAIAASAAKTAALDDALQASIDGQLQEIEDRMEAADGAEVEARLAQLETRVEGLAGELGALIIPSGDAELSEEDRARLAAYSAAVEGLRAELGELAAQQGALSQRIDDVSVTADRRVAEAEAETAAAIESVAAVKSAGTARAAMATIDAALASGVPFDAALADFGANSDIPVPEALGAVAASGVATLAALRDGFADYAHDAIRADIKSGDGNGVGGRLVSFLEAQVATRSLTPKEGGSTDAVLSRAEDALRQDNLAAALTELAALPESSAEAMSGWTTRAAARADAIAAFTDISAQLNAAN